MALTQFFLLEETLIGLIPHKVSLKNVKFCCLAVIENVAKKDTGNLKGTIKSICDFKMRLAKMCLALNRI